MRSLGRREHHATASRGTRASIGGLRLVPVTILSTPMVANRKKGVVNDGEHMAGVALSWSADSQGVASGEMWQEGIRRKCASPVTSLRVVFTTKHPRPHGLCAALTAASLSCGTLVLRKQ